MPRKNVRPIGTVQGLERKRRKAEHLELYDHDHLGVKPNYPKKATKPDLSVQIKALGGIPRC